MHEDINVLVEHWFTFHPVQPGQAEKYEAIRAAAKEFAKVIVELCPGSADRTVAIRHIRDAVFNANASIACDGR